MSVVLIRSLILYIVVIFGVRLMGKRQLGELQPSELVITILISNIATLPLEDTSIPLVLGILPILTLVCFEVVISWVTLKSLRMRRIISGRPKIIVRNGQIEQATMRDLRLSVDDLMTALRQQQVFDISQVQFAVMETTGTVSVYLKAACQPLTPEDIQAEAGRLLRLGEKDLPLATLCGMSAVFSALFGTPLTAAIFAMEVISVGVFYYAGLIPCLTAALVGYLVSLLMGVPPTRFAVADPGLDPWTMLLVILLAIGCAVVSILFCRGLQKTGKLAARLLPNPYGRVLVGGALVIVLTLLVGNTNYNGAGMEMVERAVSGDVEPWAWLWKLLFTAVTIGFGYKGGEVVPSFFVGACFGCVLGGAMGLPAGFGAAIGLVAVFCGAVNCPIASVFLSIELFSTGDVLYFAMACAISYLLSGYCGLYSSQTILYSKMRAEFINIHTNENEEHHG